MAANEITVKLDGVSKSFGEFTAVKELTLAVRAGRVFGLLGPNGAGKTTTIRMIVNITAPDSGAISVFDRKIDSELQNRIGYLPALPARSATRVEALHSCLVSASSCTCPS